MALASGFRIGSYEIRGALGAGGMGEVYRARDTRLHRDVALKILPERFALDPDRLARFHREAHTLASLSHPNIGVIHGLEEDGGSNLHALVLELIEGPRWQIVSSMVRCRSTRRCRLPGSSWTRSMRRTRKASFTATSNPPTSRSVMTAP